MKFFSSELGHEYSKTLTFGYCNYAMLEPGDELSDLYALGYLPYSGSPESRGMFYMARSARLHLPTFELDSECRRVTKKFDDLMTREVIPFSEFNITEDFLVFWLDYFRRAHGNSTLSRERLMHWLNFGIISHVGVYKNKDSTVVAYTLEVWDDTMAHDWYQAYAEELDKQSFGVWLLIDVARAAQKTGRTYYYPGTVYAQNAYKTNFPSLEFWTGETWMKDAKNRALKDRLSTDPAKQIAILDEWK